MNKEVLEAAASLKLCLDRISQLQKAQEWASATGATPNTRRHCKISQEIQRWYIEAQNARNALSLAVMDALYPDTTDCQQAGLDVRQMTDYSLLMAYNVVTKFTAILGKMAEWQNSSIGTINPYALLNAITAEMNSRTNFRPADGWIDQIIAGDMEETESVQ